MKQKTPIAQSIERKKERLSAEQKRFYALSNADRICDPGQTRINLLAELIEEDKKLLQVEEEYLISAHDLGFTNGMNNPNDWHTEISVQWFDETFEQ